MRRNEITADAPLPLAGVPRHIVDDVRAGLDDLQNSRGDSGEIVLASIDKKLADWRAGNKHKKNGHGESRPDRTKTDQ
jgi:hypothetical protein